MSLEAFKTLFRNLLEQNMNPSTNGSDARTSRLNDASIRMSLRLSAANMLHIRRGVIMVTAALRFMR
jgi:hypothetical protein